MNKFERFGTTSAEIEVARKNLLHQGCAVLPGVLTKEETAEIRTRLWAAAETSRQGGLATYMPVLDPNDRNVRVFNLLSLDPVFLDLIQHPKALALVEALLGKFIVSNFTANIALPGSGSMFVHSDQGLVMPEPWNAPYAINIIWCLNDIHEENGATRYFPGSHRFSRRADLPADPASHMRSFEAAEGSIIAMDGRVWHTSGANRTENEERALLFGYYTAPFIRQQWNWTAALPDGVKSDLAPETRSLLGLDIAANLG